MKKKQVVIKLSSEQIAQLKSIFPSDVKELRVVVEDFKLKGSTRPALKVLKVEHIAIVTAIGGGQVVN